MKRVALLFIGFIGLLLIGCSGSDAYQGKWKGMTPDGDKVQFTFEPKKFTINDSTQKAKTYNYTQNSVNINNGVRTYGIKLEDGREYKVHFPVSGNESVGLIMAENGSVLYSVSREDYIKSDDIYSLK